MFKDAKDTKTKAAYDKLMAETEAAAIGKVDSRYKEFESLLKGMTTKSTQNQWENMTAPKAGGDIQQIVDKVSDGFNLEDTDEIRLKETYIDVMSRSGFKVDREALKDADLKDLFRANLF